MRKLFWCSVVVAVSAGCGVYLASKTFERTPSVALGKTLTALGGEEASSVEPEALGLPVAVPVDEKVIAVADPSTPGHIFIEGEPTADVTTTVALPVTGPATAVQPTAPPANQMPYASDDEDGGLQKMPYAAEEESEPRADAGQVEAWQLLEQAARAAVSDPMATADQEACPGHSNYDHGPVCPYTGRSCPEYRISPAAPQPEDAEPKPEGSPKQEPQHSASKKVPAAEVKSEWPTFGLDTMEFRPSDAGFRTPEPFPF